MKLNYKKWIQDLRETEAAIRAEKLELRKPEANGPKHRSHFRIECLKASAQRLLALRRLVKGKTLEVRSFYYFQMNPKCDPSSPFWYVREPRFPYISYRSITWPAESTLRMVDAEPGWKESYLLPEPAAEPLPESVVAAG